MTATIKKCNICVTNQPQPNLNRAMTFDCEVWADHWGG